VQVLDRWWACRSAVGGLTAGGAVTEAFGYTGSYLRERLQAAGRRVRTLTAHPRPKPGDRVEVHPFSFDDRTALVASLRGADTLYNTYWVRYVQGGTTYEQAVRNSRVLVEAAAEAGVPRLVHVSITKPRQGRGGGRRPRRRPVPAAPRRDRGPRRPVRAARGRRAGHHRGRRRPESFAFEDLVTTIARPVGARCRVVHAPPAVVGLVLPVIRPVEACQGSAHHRRGRRHEPDRRGRRPTVRTHTVTTTFPEA
jgi:NAD dependent epimerase/dehydratase family